MIKRARFWKIPATFDTDTYELSGRNSFYDFLIHDVAVPLDYAIQTVLSWFGIEQDGWMIEIENGGNNDA